MRPNWCPECGTYFFGDIHMACKDKPRRAPSDVDILKDLFGFFDKDKQNDNKTQRKN